MSPELGENIREQYKDEYKEVSSNLRHYSNLRFAIFTVLLAIQIGLMGFGSDWIAQTPVVPPIAANIGGLIATFVFWVFHERVVAYREIFVQRAIYLETELGYNQYSSRPKPILGFLGTSFVSRLFFSALGIFWITAFFLQ